MNSSPFRLTPALVCIFAFASIRTGQAQNQPLTAVVTSVDPSIPTSQDAGDQAWSQVLASFQPQTATENSSAQKATSAAPGTQELNEAAVAKDFYTRFPKHRKYAEARRLEAVFLMGSVMAGNTSVSAKMIATAQTVRSDATIPASERAIVAGTYDFYTANQSITSADQAITQFEAVSRGLIKEFPDQPQGYVSLLTQTSQRDVPTSRAMAQEVLNAASAPAEAKAQAKMLLNRLNLVGQTVQQVFGTGLVQGLGSTWKQNAPGLIYIWATWSPNSLQLGQMLATKDWTHTNVLGVCVDPDQKAAADAASANSLPGQLIYIPNGVGGDLAIQLGANAAPLVYFVDGNGVITDVRGLSNLEAKMKAVGL